MKIAHFGIAPGMMMSSRKITKMNRMSSHSSRRSPRPATAALLPAYFNADTGQARESLRRLRGLAAAVVVPLARVGLPRQP
jgi:hypothetical protein